jgi:hypothetical protein
MNFGGGVASFEVKAASDDPCNIEVRLDSPEGSLVGVCMVEDTGGWQSFANFRCPINRIDGIRNLYLVFKGAVKLSWFKFEK